MSRVTFLVTVLLLVCPPNRGQPWREGGGDTLIESQGSTKKSCVGDYTGFLGHNSLLNNTHLA